MNRFSSTHMFSFTTSDLISNDSHVVQIEGDSIKEPEQKQRDRTLLDNGCRAI